MKNKIKYLKYMVVIGILMGGLYFLQVGINNTDVPTPIEDIKLDENGKQIIDNEGKSNKDNETKKGTIDTSTLSEEELREYESYDPLGRNAQGQETNGRE